MTTTARSEFRTRALNEQLLRLWLRERWPLEATQAR